jgi:hypothetical protein
LGHRTLEVSFRAGFEPFRLSHHISTFSESFRKADQVMVASVKQGVPVLVLQQTVVCMSFDAETGIQLRQ